MMRVIASLAMFAALAACPGRSTVPEIRTVEVPVPVAVPCKAEVDVRDSYSDAAAAQAADIFEMVRALLVGRAERDADLTRLKGAVTGCGGAVK